MSHHLGRIWAETLRRSPDAPAVIETSTGRTWTRRQLGEAANAWRTRLPAPEKLKGRRVILAHENGAAWLAAFLALIERDAIVAALDPHEPEAAQREMARAIGAVWLWRGGTMEAVTDREPPRRSGRRDICLRKITSGSTGTPKALPFTHAQMLADGRQICASMKIAGDDVNLAAIPFGHSYGLGNLVLPLLLQGTAIVCASGQLPHVLAAECARWKPTVFPAVPALLRGLVLADVEPALLASLRIVISAGAPLRPEIAEAFEKKFGRRIHGFYGSSETGGICFDRDGEATLTGRSVGTPLRGVRLRFGRGRRFVVESAAVMQRGRHSPADRGELNDAGELVLLGRAGRIVKIAGRRLDLGEIEAILRSIPGVREACAFAHPDRPDAIAAVVAGEISAATLRESLKARTAAWKIPGRLVVVPEFPLTARGKADTRKLRALLATPEFSRGTS
jgi:acyl-CoA synthetase (AMP-forming)/AMP-acid ligase II